MVKLKNKTITSYEVSRPNKVVGAKAGSKASQPNIADDTVASLSLAKILYGLGEGEISGIVGGAKGIYLEDTPLEGEDGTRNFDNVTYDFRSGTLEQEYIKGFPDVSNEIPVAVELKSTSAWVKAITKSELSAARIRLSWTGLKEQILKSGDVKGYRIDYAIDVKTGSGAYVEVLKTKIEDKVSGKYERTHRIDLPESSNGWTIRVRRLTANANSELIQDKMYIESITEVIDIKLRYPNTALLGLQYDAKTFSRIAKIAVRAKGKIISIPTNYDTNTGLYSGIWNGTFKQAYSNNPAWIFYDIITNSRYGLGKRIDSSMVDKWALYSLGVYCDELIDDGSGNGTKEKRYSCNVYLQTQQDAFTVLQQLAGIFKAITYWNGEQIVLDADVPQDPVYTFSRSNVIDGIFEYTGTRLRDRHTVAKVAFDNPNEGFKTEYEYIRDEAGIAKFGINIVDISAIGCTSRGQAQRAGLWALKSEQLETRTVSFSTGLEGFIPQVGNIIEVSDELLAGRANGGRIAKVQSKVITLDRSLPVKVNDFLVINGSDGISETRKVTNVNDKVITVATAYTKAVEGAVFAIRSVDLNTMLFRVMSIKPDDNNVFSISAIQHEPLKYTAIDFGADVKPTAITTLKPINTVEAPATVNVSATYKVVQGQTVATMVIQWSQVKDAVSYRVEWRRDNGNWIAAPATGNVSLEVEGVYAGNYLARVIAVNAFDVSSNATTSTLTEIKGKVGAPKALAGISATGLLFGMSISWGFQAGSEDTAYTEIETATNASGANTATLGSFSYPTNKTELTGLQGGLKVYYRGRTIDKLGNVSTWSNWVSGTTDNSADKLLTQLEGQITESQLFTDLGSKIDRIDTNKSEIDLELAAIDSAITEANTKLAESKAIIDTNKVDLTKAKEDITKADGLIKANKDKLVLTDAELAEAKTKVTTLESNYNSNKATVENKLTTLTNKDISFASDLSTLSSNYGASEAKLVRDLEVLTDKDTSLTNQLTTLDSDYKGNKANVTQELTALATKDTAIVKDINSLNTKTDNTNTEISTVKTLVADNKTSIANTKNELKAEFDKLEIGGRNLLLASKTNEVIKSETATFNYARYFLTENLVVGQTYTFKASARITAGNFTLLSIYLYDGGSRFDDVSLVDGQIEYTFTATSNTPNSLLVYAGRAGSTANRGMVITDAKLEKGNKATDWTIAPEETDAALETNKASIESEATARATADETLTGKYDTLKSNYDTNKATVSQSLETLTNKDISLTSTLTALDSDYKGNKSTVSSKLTTLSNKDIALTNSLDTLKSTVENTTTLYNHKLGSDIDNWTNYTGSGELVKGNVLTIGNNSGNDYAWLIRNENVPVKDGVVYKITCRIKSVIGEGRIYIGVAGVLADGVSFVSAGGSNSYSGHYYIGSYTELDTDYRIVTGYIATASTDLSKLGSNTKNLHEAAKFFRPLIIANYQEATGKVLVDYFNVETVDAKAIADIVTEATTRATADEAITELYTALNSDYDTNKSSVSGKLITLTNDAIALAKRVTATEAIADDAQARVDTAERAITTNKDAIATAERELNAKFEIKDTRYDNEPPSWYYANYAMQIGKEFKRASALNLDTLFGEDLYVYLETPVQWRDSSGGRITQTVYAKDGRLFQRSSLTASTWSAWIESESTTGSAAKVKALKDFIEPIVSGNSGRIKTVENAVADADNAIAKVRTDLTADFNSIEVGGRNLLKANSIQPYGATTINSNGVATLPYTPSSNAWLKFNIGDLVGVEKNTTYVLSFKIKRTSGNLSSIGGHTDPATVVNTRRNGVVIQEAYSSWSDESYPNTTATQRYEVIFTTSSSHGLMYIQPSRPSGYSNTGTVQIWDIQIERGNRASDYKPTIEDTDSATSAAISVESSARASAIGSVTEQVTTLQTRAERTAVLSVNVRDFPKGWTSYSGGADKSAYYSTYYHAAINTSPNLGKDSGYNGEGWYLYDEAIKVNRYLVYKITAETKIERGDGKIYLGLVGHNAAGVPISRSGTVNAVSNSWYAGSYNRTSAGGTGWYKWEAYYSFNQAALDALETDAPKILLADAENTTEQRIETLKPLWLSNYANEYGYNILKYFTVELLDSDREAKIQQSFKTVDGLSASWTMKLDVNGYVSGVGQYNNGTTSQFAVRADQFYIADPNSKTASTPFQVTGGKTVIKDAYIRDASIDLAKIKTASITNLSSLSSTIGHFKSANSGARLEIKDSLLSVYDSNNRLRVRLGLW